MGVSSQKTNIEEGLLKKGAWTVCRCKGGGIFEGGLIPQCTLWVCQKFRSDRLFLRSQEKINQF